jgi:hypothetical protein
MKKVIKITPCILLTVVTVLMACKREASCEDCLENNKPPIALAGPDRLIILPTDSALLDGSSSLDPDGSITSYQWTKIVGPAFFKINNPPSVITMVKNLIAGVYLFELKVFDNKGLSAKDTVEITVSIDGQLNRPPVAYAGTDQAITLPVNTIMLDGSSSLDPDSNLTSYAWTKISGPSSFNISNPNAVLTQITNLIEGIYQFELKVTDLFGLFSIDTMQATVLPGLTLSGNGILIPFGTLSIARAGIVSATAGDKILFAGGFTTCGTSGSPICNWFSRVDIYDMNTHMWSIAELSQARIYMGVAALGNKIFFAGGYLSSDNETSRVDIYDAGTNTWSTAELSEARINPAAASAGNKIYFGGGAPLDGGIQATASGRVDVYDGATGTWSTTELSEARTSLAAASIGNKIMFAGGSGSNTGGFSKRVDSYNSNTDQWSIDSISEARSGLVASTLGTKVFLAGGWIGGVPPVYSDRIDIYDDVTQNWSIANLSQPAEFSGVATDGTRILFFPYGTRMEIYNSVFNNWYFSELNQPLYSSSIIAAGNQIYVAGGALNNTYLNYTSQVWRILF